tara:strand:- start:33995 stop:37429 length:3435 start_codon:yes stop_codon:yes gene_type:complete
MEDLLKEVFIRDERKSQEILKVLILEDVLTDAELVKLQFEELNVQTEYRVTQTKEQYIQYLKLFKPDIIISDFNLPNFDGLKALKILRVGLKDEITPFVFVTGTLGEENAVKAIKGGATDFIIKERVNHLPAAVLRALREKTEKINRKEAYRREQLKERRFKKLVQEGSDLIAITDYEGKVKFLSDNYEKTLGYTSAELSAADPFKYIHQDDIEDVRAAFSRIKKEPIIKIKPYRFLDTKKNWRWLHSTATNMFADEAIEGIVINSSEVTELVNRELDLKLSNEKYYLASLATQDLIYDWDLVNSSIKRDEKVLQRIFGHGSKLSANESFWKDHIHPEDITQYNGYLKKCFIDNTQTLVEFEYRFRRKDGSYAYVYDKGYILRDKSGVAVRLIGAVRNISEQKEKEQTKDLILSLSHHLSKSKSLSECTNEVLRTLVNSLKVSYAELWLPAHHNNHLNLISQYTEEFPKELMFVNNGQLLKKDGLPGTVLNRGKIIIWNDIKNKPRFTRKESAKKVRLESAIGIPISHADKVIGVFVFFSKEKNHNFKRDLKILQDVSRWISPELQRKQASEELDRFFTVSADLLCIIGTDGYFKKINPAFTSVLGYSESEFLRDPLKHFLHPDDHQLTRKRLQKLQQGEKAIHFENRNISKDGKVKWFSWSAIIQPKDEVVFAVGKEITEKKKLEELVKETQFMAKIGSWEFDLIKQTLHWTSQTKKIHEVDPDYEPDLDTAINFYKEGESRQIITQCVNNGIQYGTPWDVELQIITAKGREKWVRAMGQSEMIEGKCVRLYGSFQDIEEQKKREVALKNSYRRFELASKATCEAIYEWDFRTNNLHWTENYQILFGYDEEIEKFNNWESKIHPLDHDRIINSLEDLMENTEQLFWKNEYRFIKKDKRVAFVEERGYLIRDKNGNPISMIGSVQDLTEKKMFQEQLLENTIQSQEKERNRIAQELHDGIVQEMVVCSMRTDLLRKSVNNNPELENKVNEITEYIKQLTNNTRDISHNLLSANVAEMTFGELLERLDLNLRIMSKIKFNIEHFLDLRLNLDESIKINLYRVIQELANNIIKHSDASKALILVEQIKESISVKVVDNGKGINEKHSSSGIGLANVTNRINMIGGKIDFKNGEMGGLEVSISVPIG